MTRALQFAIFPLLAVSTVPAGAQQRYAIQPGGDSKIELRVAKTGLYRGKVHLFVFPAFSGTLVYDAARPTASQVRLTLAASALKLTDKWLNEKDFREVQRYALEDMLAAQVYPEIAFVSSEIAAIDATHYKVEGTLTIRGQGKPCIVNVTLEPSAGPALRLTGEAVVKLTDYGLKPPKAALGLIGTKDEMHLSFALAVQPEAARTKP